MLEAEPRDGEMALLEISRLLGSSAGLELGFGALPYPLCSPPPHHNTLALYERDAFACASVMPF